MADTPSCVARKHPLSGSSALVKGGYMGSTRPSRGGKVHYHNALDYSAQTNTDLSCPVDGTIVAVVEDLANKGAAGNYIQIRGKDGCIHTMAHLSSMSVTAGQVVTAGQSIGKTGGKKGAPGSGDSQGPHLHWQVIGTDGKPLDPRLWEQGVTSGGGSAGEGSTASAPAEGGEGISFSMEGSAGFLQPLSSSSTESTSAQLEPSMYISEDLFVEPWFDDEDLNVANPMLKSYKPITFKVQTREFGESNFLPADADGEEPAVIALNCSLAEMNVSSKQIYQRTATRTGMHITLWGAEPDTISGSGVTGAWMNYFGLTSFMSTKRSSMPQELIDYLMFRFDGDNSCIGLSANSAKGARFPEQQHSNLLSGWFDDPTADPLLPKGWDKGDSGYTDTQFLNGSEELLRVAAQDAFAEIIALFKYNAITRFKADNYDGYFSDRDQGGANVWSEKYGDSKYRMAVRNNDVMYRGFVVLNTPDGVYQGFFKSLTFSEDANRPYLWNFDFVFQVQRTIKVVRLPDPTSQEDSE
jgi:hypothetical protein